MENLRTQISKQHEDLVNAETEKHRNLLAIDSNYNESINADEFIQNTYRSRQKSITECEKLRISLASINISPSEYLNENVQSSFDTSELQNLQARELILNQIIMEEENRLQTLKQTICSFTRDNISTHWEDLILNLRKLKEDTLEECKIFYAQIAAGILTTEVISEMQEQEDDFVQDALKLQKIVDPIKAVTNKYTGVDLDGEELVVFNDSRRYPLSVLSTGAKEQVLLALRIGLASHILGDEKMFLILDDAFQHSDWDRRENLIDEMAVLAKNGWQIFYFSMDDHIKMLFEERIKPELGDRFQAFSLISQESTTQNIRVND